MFEPLRRWTGQQVPEEELPIEATIAALDHSGIDFGLLSAWCAPGAGALISNEQVADWVSRYPDRLGALAAVDLDKPMEAVGEIRHCILANWDSRACESFRGCGRRRQPIAATIRFTLLVSTLVYLCVRKWDTQVLYDHRRPGVRSPI